MLRFLILVIFTCINEYLYSENSLEESGIDPGSLILNHVIDDHEIHLMTLHKGSDNELHITVPLPIIVYSSEYGFDVFFI